MSEDEWITRFDLLPRAMKEGDRLNSHHDDLIPLKKIDFEGLTPDEQYELYEKKIKEHDIYDECVDKREIVVMFWATGIFWPMGFKDFSFQRMNGTERYDLNKRWFLGYKKLVNDKRQDRYREEAIKLSNLISEHEEKYKEEYKVLKSRYDLLRDELGDLCNRMSGCSYPDGTIVNPDLRQVYEQNKEDSELSDLAWDCAILLYGDEWDS